MSKVQVAVRVRPLNRRGMSRALGTHDESNTQTTELAMNSPSVVEMEGNQTKLRGKHESADPEAAERVRSATHSRLPPSLAHHADC